MSAEHSSPSLPEGFRLKKPNEFFTNPQPNTIMNEVRAEIAAHALEEEMHTREYAAYVAELMPMVVGAEIPPDAYFN